MRTQTADSAWKLYGMLAMPWYRAGGTDPLDCVETVLELLAAQKRGQLEGDGELTVRAWEKIRKDLSKALDLPPPTDLGRFFERAPGLLEETRRAVASLMQDKENQARAFLEFLMHAPQTEFRHTPYSFSKWSETVAQLNVKLMGKPSRAPLYCPFDSSGWLPLLLASQGWDVRCELENQRSARVLALFAYVGDWKLIARIGNAIREPQWAEGSALQSFKHCAAITSFGLRLKDEVERDRYLRFPVRLHYGEAVQIAHLIAHTKGRVMAIVPEGFLFRTAGGERDYKEQLVRRGLLSAVIRLPRGAFAAYSGVQTSIVIFETDRSENEVLFVDAKSDLDTKARKRHELGDLTDSVNQILSIVERRRSSAISATASYAEIAAMDFNLSVDRYVRSKEDQQIATALDESKTIELADVAEIIRPQSVAGEESRTSHVFAEVGLQDLQTDGSIQQPSKLVHVDESSLSRANRQRLEPGDVLLSVRGRIGAAGMVPATAKDLVRHPWIASQAFVILRLRSNSPISSLALYRYLSSPMGQGLLQSLAAGATVPMVSIGDVKKFRVMIPTGQEQREIERQYEKLLKMRSQIKELETQVDELAASGWPMTKISVPTN